VQCLWQGKAEKTLTEQTEGLPKRTFKNMDWHDPSTYLGLTVSAFVLVIVLGVVLGLRRHVLVFRNFDDVALIFFSQLFLGFTVFSLLSLALGTGMRILSYTLLGVSVGLFLYMIYRTFDDNDREIAPTAVALLTKLVFSWLIILSIGNVLNPGGQTAAQRRNQRGSGFIRLFVLVPLIMALVVDPMTGVYSPRWLKSTVGGTRLRP
jgi:hypothetical protein